MKTNVELPVPLCYIEQYLYNSKRQPIGILSAASNAVSHTETSTAKTTWRNTDHPVIGFGFSYCTGTREKFDKKIGREIAYGRARSNLIRAIKSLNQVVPDQRNTESVRIWDNVNYQHQFSYMPLSFLDVNSRIHQYVRAFMDRCDSYFKPNDGHTLMSNPELDILTRFDRFCNETAHW